MYNLNEKADHELKHGWETGQYLNRKCKCIAIYIYIYWNNKQFYICKIIHKNVIR